MVSGQARRDRRTINDGEEPASSNDPTSYFDRWPRKGTSEWGSTLSRNRPRSRSAGSIGSTTGRGEVRVPAWWRLLYRDGNEWKPVRARESYGVEQDIYNRVAFVADSPR